jgi:cytochrome c
MRYATIGMISVLALVAACSQPSAPTEDDNSSAATSNVQAGSATTPPTPTLTDAQKKELLEQLPAAYQTADLANGEAKFALCQACHNTAQGAGDSIGPNLYGVFGRKAGAESGFSYSNGLKALGVTWNAEQIDHWIANPRAMVPDTKMTYVGMSNAKDRVDVVAYLKTITSPPPSN